MPTFANSSTIDPNHQVTFFLLLFIFMNFDNYFLLIKQRFVKRTKLNMNYHVCVF